MRVAAVVESARKRAFPAITVTCGLCSTTWPFFRVTSTRPRVRMSAPSPSLPSALALPRQTPERCTDESGPSRRSCLWTQGDQPGLIAQAALFELGLFEMQEGNGAAAVVAWERSLDRFPDGVLAPEARLGMLAELTRQHRYAEAIAVARAFEDHSRSDPRAAEVAKFRAQLEGFAALEKPSR